MIVIMIISAHKFTNFNFILNRSTLTIFYVLRLYDNLVFPTMVKKSCCSQWTLLECSLTLIKIESRQNMIQSLLILENVALSTKLIFINYNSARTC